QLAVPNNLRELLTPLEQDKGSLVKLVDEKTPAAAWHLQLNGDHCELFPGTGLLQRADDSTEAADDSPLFGPYDANPQPLLPVLKERLGRIARAQALIGLAEQPAAQGEFNQTSSSVGIAVDILRFNGPAAKTAEVLQSGREIKLHAGDHIAFSMKNTSKRLKI